MNKEELKDLNEWIAKEVMGYKFGERDALKDYCQPPPYNFGVIHRDKLPQYVSDDAAAFQVLIKCIETFKKTVCQCKCTEGFNVYLAASDYSRTTATAATLPMAICLMAKRAFTSDRQRAATPAESQRST